MSAFGGKAEVIGVKADIAILNVRCWGVSRSAGGMAQTSESSHEQTLRGYHFREGCNGVAGVVGVAGGAGVAGCTSVAAGGRVSFFAGLSSLDSERLASSWSASVIMRNSSSSAAFCAADWSVN